MNKEKIQKVIDALEGGFNNANQNGAFCDVDSIEEALSIMQEELEKPAPEPVGYTHKNVVEILDRNATTHFVALTKNPRDDFTKPVYAEQPAKNPLIYGVIMPKELTADNGAKSLLSGEFFEKTTITCPDCDGGDYRELETDRCGTCNDTGDIEVKIPVSWTTIKAIYAKAVENLSIKEQE